MSKLYFSSNLRATALKNFPNEQSVTFISVKLLTFQLFAHFSPILLPPFEMYNYLRNAQLTLMQKNEDENKNSEGSIWIDGCLLNYCICLKHLHNKEMLG